MQLVDGKGDAELKELVSQWRGAARQAAEVVFEGAKERVDNMGGVAAWRKRERERVSRQQQWEREGWIAEARDGDEDEGLEDEEGDDEETRARKQAKREGLYEKRDDWDAECDVQGLAESEQDVQEDDIATDEVSLADLLTWLS